MHFHVVMLRIIYFNSELKIIFIFYKYSFFLKFDLKIQRTLLVEIARLVQFWIVDN
jgi:hypothetical protein